MRPKFAEKVLIAAAIIAVLLSNPPIITYINDYCKTSLLVLGVPTLWLYLTSIWSTVILIFIIAATVTKEEEEEKR